MYHHWRRHGWFTLYTHNTGFFLCVAFFGQQLIRIIITNNIQVESLVSCIRISKYNLNPSRVIQVFITVDLWPKWACYLKLVKTTAYQVKVHLSRQTTNFMYSFLGNFALNSCILASNNTSIPVKQNTDSFSKVYCTFPVFCSVQWAKGMSTVIINDEGPI